MRASISSPKCSAFSRSKIAWRSWTRPRGWSRSARGTAMRARLCRTNASMREPRLAPPRRRAAAPARRTRRARGRSRGGAEEHVVDAVVDLAGPAAERDHRRPVVVHREAHALGEEVRRASRRAGSAAESVASRGARRASKRVELSVGLRAGGARADRSYGGGSRPSRAPCGRALACANGAGERAGTRGSSSPPASRAFRGHAATPRPPPPRRAAARSARARPAAGAPSPGCR